MTWPSVSPGMWHAADLTVLEHAARDEAPGAGRCRRCAPDGSCLLLSWAVRVRAGGHVPYPGGPVAPAVTYLFEQPLALHEADGWRRTGQDGAGELDGHWWWELRRPG